MTRSQCTDFLVSALVGMNGQGRFEEIREQLLEALTDEQRKTATSLLAEAIIEAIRHNRITRRSLPNGNQIGADRNTRYIYQADYGFKAWGYGYNGWPTQPRERA